VAPPLAIVRHQHAIAIKLRQGDNLVMAFTPRQDKPRLKHKNKLANQKKIVTFVMQTAPNDSKVLNG
jgi:hypothetical protein